jgi:AraC-like DNA-binding protein
MKEGERFQTFTPRNPDIREHVAYYYLHSSLKPDFETNFIYYPHYRNGLTTYIGSDVVLSEFGSKVTPCSKKSASTFFARNYDAAIDVHLKGPFYKLGIAFEPLGLNHFINRPFCEIAPERVNRFTEFGDQYDTLVKKLVKSDASPTEALDAYLLSQKTSFSNERLQSVLDILFEKGCELSIQTLAESLGMSRKTLLRDFQKDLACSVKTYQKLIRFRQALNTYQQAVNKSTFTELALDHSYYDQPAFIKNFKQITGLNPRSFFEKLKQYGQADTFWRTN